MKKAFCGWMRGVALALALAGLSSNANGTETEEIRFQGGHPWLSRNQMVDLDEAAVNTDAPSDATNQGASNELQHAGRLQRSVPDDRIHSISNGRYFDLVIAMHEHREADEREKIGLIVTNFALAVYEATEGRHFIGDVFIVEEPGCRNADIHWYKQDLPDPNNKNKYAFTRIVVDANGIAKSLYIANFDTFLDSPYAGGRGLAHEWGHYEYGFEDEYVLVYNPLTQKNECDKTKSVKHSLMGALETVDGFFSFNDFKEQCNLSYKSDKTDVQGKWRNTEQTAQHRMFDQSCLEQLVTPADPKERGGFKVPQWPEFSSGIDPIDPEQPPKIDLDKANGIAMAKKYLHVEWIDDDKRALAICIDISSSMTEEQVENGQANTKNLVDTVSAGTMLGIWTFNGSVNEIVPLQEVTDDNRSVIKSRVDNIGKPNGSTKLWDAADEALKSMRELNPEGKIIGSILLMTDGDDTASQYATFSSVVKTCQKMGVAFNSIAFGDNADTTGKLGEASAQTGGKNVSANDSLSSLGEAFFRGGGYGSDRAPFVDSQGDVGSTGTFEETFTVDSTAKNLQAVVTLSVPSAMANVVLKTPSGLRCAPKSTTDVGSESSWVFTRQSPERGTWTVLVTAPGGTRVSCQIDASAVGDPPRLLVWTDDSDTMVYAALSQGLPVDGARVRALVDDNGTRREVAFTGTGGGCYQLPLSACGSFTDGFTVRADATKGTATYTYVGVLGYDMGGEGGGITESFTRSEWLDLRRLNEIPLRYVEVHPRWPWEGKVDVDFHVVVTDKNTKVSAKLVGVDNQTGDAYAVSSVTCDDTLSDLGTGAHRLTWNAAADLPGMDIEDFAIRFDVTTGTALGVVTGLTASAGTYFDGVHVAWGTVANATGYRVYRSETADGTGRVLLATQTGRTYTDSTAVIGKKYYYYWIQPIIVGANGVVKHEGQLAVSGGAWRCQLGGVSGLSASGGSHYDGVHLSWTGANGATSYRIYRGTTANAASKTLLTTTSSTYYIDTSAAKLQKYYYYWVEPVAVVSGTTYTGAMNSSPVSGWRNKLGTPTFHFANWRPGHKSRPDIDLYIDSPVSGATRYEYMSGDQSWRWKAMEAVGEGSSGYDISSMLYGSSATIGWAWAYRYELRVYVRAANNEGVGDWVKWNLADHLKESAFKNSEFYKLYPKP